MLGVCGRLAKQRTYIPQHVPRGPSRAHLLGAEPKASGQCSPASDVAAEAARSDNTGLGGIATLSTAAGFFLVIMVDAEPSFLLCGAVWSTFRWGLGIPTKEESRSLQLLERNRKTDNRKPESELRTSLFHLLHTTRMKW